MMRGRGNGRPLSRKKTIQLVVVLVLAWATQLLLHQWGFGQTTQPAQPTMGEEKFVPGTARYAAGAVLELRSEATVVGGDVKLRQVCRWSDADAAVFAPIADLVLVRLGQNVPFRAVSIAEIKQTLRDAGVNLAAINFAGATRCTVNRSDVTFNEGEALQKWIDAQHQKDSSELATLPEAEPATQPANVDPVLASSRDEPPIEPKLNKNLRDLLIQDLSTRLDLPVEALQVSFRMQDERLLNLAEPIFKFQIDPQRVRDLGEVSWQVTVFAEGSTQKAIVGATARAWQHQMVVMKPLSFKQVIRDQDVVARRTLVDRKTDDVLLESSQVIGQQAARDLKPGTVLTARLVDAVQLVRSGQFVTVVFKHGAVELKSAARALEAGSFGQTIRVKNETTREVFEVVITGPQTAAMNNPNAPSPVKGGAIAKQD